MVRPETSGRQRRRFDVRGVVQGVGFRPFVYTLARSLGLSGQVSNSPEGAVVEVEGDEASIARFALDLQAKAPPLAAIVELHELRMQPRGGTEFVIGDSRGGPGRTLVSADVATCQECLDELADPADRRYRYPFVNCTNCGPRFTIITGLPYDRPLTTMARFKMCADCRREYSDPANRRFHAQPIACPACGPTLELWTDGAVAARGDTAMQQARTQLAEGAILAVKGIGGYHLACDASNQAAVTQLRSRKARGDKPFAIMAADLDTAATIVHLEESADRELLLSAARPIVLLRRRDDATGLVCADVAPGNPDLGVMLPYTPLHRLLFGLPDDPVGPRALVLTSGNLSGEPIVTDDGDALGRLARLADGWLRHDRDIEVPCDDSVVRMVGGVELPVRRSRGYAPLPIALPTPIRPTLAVGGDLKNTLCLGADRYGWLSGHIGDMDDLATLTAFGLAERHLQSLTGVRPEVIATDRHPRYRSAQWAVRNAAGRPVITVQHHHAHIASCLADNGYASAAPVIGMAFDGTGFGDDGAVWGGEVLLADYVSFRRVGQLSYVPLPGGDAGVRNPCRMALSHLRDAGLPWDPRLASIAACSEQEVAVVRRQLDTLFGCVETSSMGRLFDAVSSLAGVCHRAGYDAQAAIELEGLARSAIAECGPGYRFTISPAPSGVLLAEPAPVVTAVYEDAMAAVAPQLIAARFHLAVADLVLTMAIRVRQQSGLDTVALSGGVFLNALLLALCSQRLTDAGFTVLRHRSVPPSDAGLALGQLMIAGQL